VGDLNQRIEAMHKRDVLVAWAFVIGLWCAVIFVAIATWDLAPRGGAHPASDAAAPSFFSSTPPRSWQCCGTTATTATSCTASTSSSATKHGGARADMAHYQPPTQGKASQLIDVVVLVVLTVGALFVPIFLDGHGRRGEIGHRTSRKPHLGNPGPE
jgi:hypothetical protein